MKSYVKEQLQLFSWSDRWHIHFLNMCYLVAKMSKDPSTQVGCVIVREDKTVASTGFNGFPRGVNDNIEERYDRPDKYKWTEHAERNAIIAAAKHGVILNKGTLYCNYPPCPDCTRAIIQVGIELIVFPEGTDMENPLCEMSVRYKEDLNKTFTMLRESSVRCVRIPMPEIEDGQNRNGNEVDTPSGEGC